MSARQSSFNHQFMKLFLILFLSNPFFSYAAQYFDGDNFIISGILNERKLIDFKKIISKEKIQLVTFKDCTGGNALIGIKYGELININKINTNFSGSVASACANAYLGGYRRFYDTQNKNNGLMFHGAFLLDGKTPVDLSTNLIIINAIKSRLNFPLSDNISQFMKSTKMPNEGLYFIVKNNVEYTFYCDGLKEINFNKCQKIEGMTLESENIVKK
jgi:hypothetical protein